MSASGEQLQVLLGQIEEQDRRAKRRAILFTMLPILLAVALLAFTANRVHVAEKARNAALADVAAAKSKVEEYEKNRDALVGQIDTLGATQSSILDALEDVIEIGDVRINEATGEDWRKAIETMKRIPPGQRKTALFIATILGWKTVPYRWGGNSPKTGMDSSNFVKYVLTKSGVPIQDIPAPTLSESLMRQFTPLKGAPPLPGDIMVYVGDKGNLTLMYMADVGAGEKLVIGDLGKGGESLQVFYESSLDSAFRKQFIDYYRPRYQGE